MTDEADRLEIAELRRERRRIIREIATLNTTRHIIRREIQALQETQRVLTQANQLLATLPTDPRKGAQRLAQLDPPAQQ